MYVTSTTNGTTTQTASRVVLQYSPCNINTSFGNYSSMFENIPFVNYHNCLKPGQNLSLNGLYGSPLNYNFMEIWFTKCINSTANNNICYDTNTITSKLQNLYFSFKFIDNYFNSSIINNPSVFFINSNVMPISVTVYQQIWFYIRNVAYKSDLGILFEDTVIVNSFHSEAPPNVQISLQSGGSIPGSFSLLRFIMSSSTENYDRNYLKVQQFLASSGGIINGLMILSRLVSYLFTYKAYFLKLINKQFFFEFFDIKKKVNMSKNFENIL